MPRRARAGRAGRRSCRSWTAGRAARHPGGLRRRRSTRSLDVVPGLVGGGADLTGNTGTELTGCGGHRHARLRRPPAPLRRPRARHGRGHERHGAARRRSCPFGGTFFVFSDYMRGAVRLAALSQAKHAFVWSHDSVGLGEDGPTHQPIEHLASLRAIPGLRVIRPADANETRAGVAGPPRRRRARPRSSSPARSCPVLDGHRRAGARRAWPRGAYVLVDEERRRPRPRAHRHRLRGVALRRRAELLAATGSRCGSCRCRRWELFAAQPDDVPASGAAARRARRSRSRPARRLGLGALRRRRRRHRPLRRVGARRPSPWRSSASPPRTSPTRGPCACSASTRTERHSMSEAAMTRPSPGSTTSGRAPGTTTSPAPLLHRRRAGRSSSTTTASAGVTSNPTIFEKAIARRRGLRRAAPRAVRQPGPVDRGHLLGRSCSTTSAPPPTCCGRSTTRTTAATASSRSRCRPTLAHDTDGTDRAGRARSTSASTGPT